MSRVRPKQTRRCVSVTSPTYEQLRAYCEANGKSLGGTVEKIVNEFLSK